MAVIELFAVTAAERPAAVPPRLDLECNVVWLRGEHDMSTSYTDSEILAKAIALTDLDVLVDLSEVRFMDGSTVRTLVKAQAFLRGRSRSLTLRHPSSSAALTIRASGLDDLVDVQAMTLVR